MGSHENSPIDRYRMLVVEEGVEEHRRTNHENARVLCGVQNRSNICYMLKTRNLPGRLSWPLLSAFWLLLLRGAELRWPLFYPGLCCPRTTSVLLFFLPLLELVCGPRTGIEDHETMLLTSRVCTLPWSLFASY